MMLVRMVAEYTETWHRWVDATHHKHSHICVTDDVFMNHQNGMQFFAMVNFCNPGVLGTPAEFRKYYESPILASREPDATPEQLTKGEQRSQELSSIVNAFILRRTNTLLSKFQPPKVRADSTPQHSQRSTGQYICMQG
jgi:hypothetical protein